MSSATKVTIQDKRVKVAVTAGSSPAVSVVSSTLSAKIEVSQHSGVSILSALNDVNLSAISDEDFIVWDSASGKFINLTFINHTHAQYALATDFNDHLIDWLNPHAVTAAQVGLGSAGDYLALALDGSTVMTGAIETDVGTFMSNAAADVAAYRVDTSIARTTGNIHEWYDNGKLVGYVREEAFAGPSYNLVFGASGTGIGGLGLLDGLTFENIGSAGTVSFISSIGAYTKFDPGLGLALSGNTFVFSLNAESTSDKPLALIPGAIYSFNNADIGYAARPWKDLHFNGVGYLTSGSLLGTLVDGALEHSNGLYFTHGDRFGLVGSNGIKTTTTTVANTVTETTIYSHTIPADTLETNMRPIFSATGVFSADSASELLTIRFKVGGVTVHTIAVTPANGTDIAWRMIHEGTIRVSGASGTFIDFSEFSESGVAPVFSAETTAHSMDTTGDALYEVTIQWGTAKAGNSFSCTQGDLTYKH